MGEKIILKVSGRKKSAILSAARLFYQRCTPATRAALQDAVGAVSDAEEIDATKLRLRDHPDSQERQPKAKGHNGGPGTGIRFEKTDPNLNRKPKAKADDSEK